MNIAVDTNILVRAITLDDLEQARIAQNLLATAASVIVASSTLCELTWVLRKSHGRKNSEIAEVLNALVEAPNVVVDRAAVQNGLAYLESGGDFADGVIVFEGRRMGAEHFASFDRAAVQLATALGFNASQPT
jgi:predicted nucleic-acid-binding protein